MSLISLLIALFAERKLNGRIWQFNTYYRGYLKLLSRLNISTEANNSWPGLLLFTMVPAIVVYFLFEQLNNNLIHFILSTLFLIPCFGCVKIRESYKTYVLASLRGDAESCSLEKSRLQNAHALPDESFGLTLVWLNYTYYAAVMIFFVVFGPAGALFYRLLVTVNEAHYQDFNEQVPAEEVKDESLAQAQLYEIDNCDRRLNSERLVSMFDWLLVRFVSVGYLLVGHFSEGVSYWLKNLLDFEGNASQESVTRVNSAPREFLLTIALQSRDSQLDDLACTNTTCALVRLVKRNLLLMLALTAVFTLSGHLA